MLPDCATSSLSSKDSYSLLYTSSIVDYSSASAHTTTTSMAAAILDRCVPARRRERKRQKELNAQLHSRWGDTAITAPTMGGWNQPTTMTAPDKEYATTVSTRSVSNSDANASTNTSPSLHNGPGRFEKGKPNFSIQIPYDYGKDDTFVEDCLSPFTPSDADFISGFRDGTNFTGYQTIMEEAASPVARPSTASPAITYKPASEQYKKELEQNLSQPPSRLPSPQHHRINSSTNPAVILKPASEEYRKELAQMANGISRTQSPQSLRSQNTSPALRLRPSEEYLVDLVNTSRANSPPQSTHQLSSSSLPLRARSPSDTSKPGSPQLGISRSNSPRSHNTSPVLRNQAPSSYAANVSQFGMIPSPTFPEKSFAQMTTTSPSASPPHSPNSRDSISSSASHETGFSTTSSRGIGAATLPRNDSPLPTTGGTPAPINNGGSYYKSLADEYRHIAKDVEMSEMERKARDEAAAKNGGKQKEKKTYYGPQELVPTGKDLWG